MNEEEFLIKFDDEDDLDYENIYYEDASCLDHDITIETHVEDKPPELMECKTTNPHRKIHCLLLCYEPQWKQLKFVKRRESKHCCHYSQYDDVNVE